MNFVDYTLVRLADPATRTALFDQDSLEQVLGAAYDADAMGFTGPYQPIFDDVRMGVSAPPLGALEGTWRPTGSSEHTEAQFHLAGLGAPAPLRIDAVWRGAIVARFAPGGEPITSVETSWPGTGEIDADIAAANGGTMPTDPAVLEQERTARFLTRVRAALEQPDVFTGDTLRAWLDRIGAASINDLFERFEGTVELGSVKLTFGPPAPVGDTPKPLPIAAALVVRDAAGFSLADLLADSKSIVDRLQPLGLERPHDATLRPRRDVLVVWVVPSSVFDDADWPGGDGAGLTADQRRTRRRAAAGAWLAREGIGLITTDPHP